MRTKLYTIDVQISGEWKEWNGIDYAEVVKPEIQEMRNEMKRLRSNGYKVRRRFVREVNIQVLTVNCK